MLRKTVHAVAGSCGVCSAAWDVVAESKSDASSSRTAHVCLCELQFSYTKRCWSYFTSCKNKAENQSSHQSLPLLYQVQWSCIERNTSQVTYRI